jgi:hypothetical protein
MPEEKASTLGELRAHLDTSEKQNISFAIQEYNYNMLDIQSAMYSLY